MILWAEAVRGAAGFLLCLFLLLSAPAAAMVSPEMAVADQISASPQQEKVVIPFQYSNGFIVVELRFQQLLPLRFILDTGAENSILFKKEYADLLGIEYIKSIKLVGSDLSREVEAFVTQAVSLQLQGLPASRQNLIVLREDFLSVEEIVGTRIDGLIGCAFFGGKTIKIDYRRQEITVYTPKAARKESFKGFISVPLDVVQRKPYLTAEVSVRANQRVPVRLLLDTGAALSCMIHSDTDSLLQPTGRLIPGSLGKGLGGDIEGFTGLLHHLSIKNISFDNLITSFQNLGPSSVMSENRYRNGLIGNLLLERFTIVIDWSGSRLLLKPERRYNRPFDFDKSGLTLLAHGPGLDQYTVYYVIPGSPAEEAGLIPGDEITKVGIWPAHLLTLAQINKRLSGKPGKKMKLQWRRAAEIRTATFRLRNLLGEPR